MLIVIGVVNYKAPNMLALASLWEMSRKRPNQPASNEVRTVTDRNRQTHVRVTVVKGFLLIKKTATVL